MGAWSAFLTVRPVGELIEMNLMSGDTKTKIAELMDAGVGVNVFVLAVFFRVFPRQKV